LYNSVRNVTKWTRFVKTRDDKRVGMQCMGSVGEIFPMSFAGANLRSLSSSLMVRRALLSCLRFVGRLAGLIFLRKGGKAHLTHLPSPDSSILQPQYVLQKRKNK